MGRIKDQGINGITKATVTTRGPEIFTLGDVSPDKKKMKKSVAKTNTETVEVLSYDANALWNDYQENPQSLTADQRKFLGSKLDTLDIDENAKQLF
ncbi:MAG: hypothetical protein WCG98_02915 [bacterium]